MLCHWIFVSFLLLYFLAFRFHYILLRLSIVCLFTSRFCDVKFVLLCHVIDELLKHNCNSGVMKVAI